MRALLLLAFACSDPAAPKDGETGGGGDTAADTASPAGPPTVLLPDPGLGPEDFAVVVNTDDPNSAAAGLAWASARGVPEDRIHALSLGTADTLSEDDFLAAETALGAALGDDVQALVLAFTVPYRVSCMGASAAFALGFDEAYCSTPCSTTRASGLHGADTVAPWTDHGVRPTMMLPTGDLDATQALIDRGVAADGTNPPGDGWLVRTTDAARSVRFEDFARTVERFDPDSLQLTYVDNADGGGSNTLSEQQDVLFYLTGLTHVDGLDTLGWRPGALADHLTSFGGILSESNGQMPATEFIAAGATATYGTAHEPCNYTQKFPEAEVLLSRYFMGASAIEAYWKSVAWPGEGNFVGEPLARPFVPEWSWVDGALTIRTPHLPRGSEWVIQAGETEDGPWSVVSERFGPGETWGWVEVEVAEAWAPVYRFRRMD